MLKPRITNKRMAGKDHAVLTLEGQDKKRARPSPCPECPWRKDAVGVFPAEAFKHSAPTGYDVPELIAKGITPSTFACHAQGSNKPADCAGFLLSQSAAHNLALRMRTGKPPKVANPEGLDLFQDYYQMAVANGVPPDDPSITPCWRART